MVHSSNCPFDLVLQSEKCFINIIILDNFLMIFFQPEVKTKKHHRTMINFSVDLQYKIHQHIYTFSFCGNNNFLFLVIFLNLYFWGHKKLNKS